MTAAGRWPAAKSSTKETHTPLVNVNQVHSTETCFARSGYRWRPAGNKMAFDNQTRSCETLRAGWQTKVASVEFWTPWQNEWGSHLFCDKWLFSKSQAVRIGYKVTGYYDLPDIMIGLTKIKIKTSKIHSKYHYIQCISAVVIYRI